MLNKKGRTILHYVRSAQVAKVFIGAGAKVNIKDKNGLTALYQVVRACDGKIFCTNASQINQSTELVGALIQAGAKPDKHVLKLAGSSKLEGKFKAVLSKML